MQREMKMDDGGSTTETGKHVSALDHREEHNDVLSGVQKGKKANKHNNREGKKEKKNKFKVKRREGVDQSTYHTVGAFSALGVDTAAAASRVVDARVHDCGRCFCGIGFFLISQGVKSSFHYCRRADAPLNVSFQTFSQGGFLCLEWRVGVEGLRMIMVVVRCRCRCSEMRRESAVYINKRKKKQLECSSCRQMRTHEFEVSKQMIK